jgi:hypothetical protein
LKIQVTIGNVFISLSQNQLYFIYFFSYKKTRIKINKAKATFTGRNPRHTQADHPEGTKPKSGVDTMTAKGEGHVKCEVIKTKIPTVNDNPTRQTSQNMFTSETSDNTDINHT